MRRKSSKFFTGNTIRWRLTSLVFERHFVFVPWSWDALILMQAEVVIVSDEININTSPAKETNHKH